ncbi:hypothetical protein N780_02985 [Pontibacillus chungwhensis BH030062]|uniref:Uncharacterized protein n=1 Tax=Pontibacillus chungwhensis BH030062 TaxID=1385513 RepID=A0A0A2UVM2_9BACI|nr:hypothetical protein [Pontibacillus chungwhensis]KGP90788.1 hypothetical protein N780_02985 [Pontibacillus chungwhensis BH030062]
MNRIKIIASIVITLAVSGLAVWINSSNFELGKYDSFQEAIEKGIPYEVNDLIHIENYDGVNIVMYTTDPDKDELPHADFEALALAFFKGSHQDGWEKLGVGGWTHYENDNMTVYREPLRVHDNKGNALHEFYVVFGEINNPEIAIIETKSHDDESFEEAKIIRKNGVARYYIQIGQQPIVRGLSKDGDVIDRQGG